MAQGLMPWLDLKAQSLLNTELNGLGESEVFDDEKSQKRQ